MKKVLLTGYYGFDNFGDDLFAFSCALGFQVTEPDCEIIVLSPPLNSQGLHYAVPKGLKNLYSNRGLLGKIIRSIYMVLYAVKCRNIVLAGGSVVSSSSSTGMRKIQYFLSYIGLCKISAIGISVGPFCCEADKRDARLFLNILKYLTVRDEASVRECVSIGVTTRVKLCGDLVGLAPLPDCSDHLPTRASPILGVSLCKYESYVGGDVEGESARNNAIFEGILEFALKNTVVVNIFVLNGNREVGDFEISNKLAKLLSSKGVRVDVVGYVDPIQTASEICRCTAFFSIRLHGAIVSYLQGIPFVLVEYHKKCSDFLDTISYNSEHRLGADLTRKEEVFNVINELFSGKRLQEMNPSDYRLLSAESFKDFHL